MTFITIEDEGGIANLVVWPSLFQAQRRIVLAGGMIAAEGQVQREGDVIHLVAKRLTDLTGLLHGVGNYDDAFRCRAAMATACAAAARRIHAIMRSIWWRRRPRCRADQGEDAVVPLISHLPSSRTAGTASIRDRRKDAVRDFARSRLSGFASGRDDD